MPTMSRLAGRTKVADRLREVRAESRRPSAARERSVASVGLLVLAVGLGNLARAWHAQYYAARLPDLAMTTSWTYLTLTGLAWGAALVMTAVGLLRFQAWGRISALVLSSLYQVHVWVNHVFLDANPYVRQAWPRELVLTGLFLAAVWGALCWPGVREVFRS